MIEGIEFRPSKCPPAYPVSQINLNHLLLQTLGHKCFILVDNSCGHDIVEPELPLVTRRYIMGKLRKFNARDPDIFQAITNQWRRNFSIDTYSDFIPCPISRHLSGMPYIPLRFMVPREYCVLLDYSSFSAQSKPWNCDVQIFLHLRYSPLPMFTISSERAPRDMSGILPSDRLSIRFYAIDYYNDEPWLNRDLLTGNDASITSQTGVTTSTRIYAVNITGLTVNSTLSPKIYQICYCFGCTGYSISVLMTNGILDGSKC